MNEQDIALLKLGLKLKESGYSFTAITPESHRRVLERGRAATTIRDVFGWNRPASRSVLDDSYWELLAQAGALSEESGRLKSRVRFASLEGELFVHSGYPTTENDAVFFGPDTYRFASLLRREVQSARRVVDVGSGSGAGGILLGNCVDGICLVDINARARRYSAVNAQLAGLSDRIEIVESDILSAVEGDIDLVISNPPYLVDENERQYRHGGRLLGAELSVTIVREALAKLQAGGKLVLYTASAIVDEQDTFWNAIRGDVGAYAERFDYEEIDPDVFGEELSASAYSNVDRLAAVGLTVVKRHTKPLT